MRRSTLAAVLLLFLAGAPAALAGPIWGEITLALQNAGIHGTLCDHSHHHGVDRRIWSQVLGEKRDLYVYLPPNYDPSQQYPLIVYLHGIIEDDHVAATRDVHYFDKAMAEGRCPPAIVAMPNGRYKPDFPPETPLFDEDFPGASWFSRWDRGFPFDSNWCNTRAGRYRDYVLEDVVPFVEAHYPIRPEAHAHAIMGFSMAAWGSYCLALKHKDRFAVVAGIMGPLNMRWLDCHGNYKGKFDPNCWGWRTELKNEKIAFWRGLIGTYKRGVEPYFGWGPAGLAWLIDENPIELLDPNDIKPGEVAMWVGYVACDEFNLDAQTESFLYAARMRGLEVTADYRNYPIRRHTLSTALAFMPAAIEWIGTQIEPYSPPRLCKPKHKWF
jgi:S-formylglutathione hydrolase FrmB